MTSGNMSSSNMTSGNKTTTPWLIPEKPYQSNIPLTVGLLPQKVFFLF
jgi:hypothetical protein